MVITAEASGLGSVIIGSVIEHPEKVREILRLPNHCLALSILCIGYPKEKPNRREKWSYDIMVGKDSYRDIDAQDVSEYWKNLMCSDLKRQGKKISDEMVEKLFRKGNYGKSYSTHYNEEFIKDTNKKLMTFLKKARLSQGLRYC